MMLIFSIGLSIDAGSAMYTGGAFAGQAAEEGSGMLFYLIAVIAGIGNSFFHVGGGISVLRSDFGHAAKPGIFVSTGAMGVFLGPVIAAKNPNQAVSAAVCCAGMCILGIALYIFAKNQQFDVKVPVITDASLIGDARSRAVSARTASAGAILILMTICIRSYAGTIMTYSWKAVPLLGFLFALGTVLGKALGGIIGDRKGWSKTAVTSLLISMCLFVFAGKSPVCGIAGVLLFNMTMPITLTALACLFGRKYAGAAFGMTTFALFLGTLPGVISNITGASVGGQANLPAVTFISAAIICAGLACVKQVRGGGGNG